MGGKSFSDDDSFEFWSGRRSGMKALGLSVLSLLLAFSVVLVDGEPVGAFPASGNGRVTIREHKFFNPPSIGNQPTATYFTATDGFGHPTMSSSNATCARVISNAQGGIFAHLRTAHSNNSLDELPCGTHSGNSDRGVEVQIDGVLIIPAGASSLRVRAHNKAFSGTNRAVWIGLWTSEGPDVAGLVERAFIKTGTSTSSITADVPFSTTCVSPGAFAFRLYIFDGSPSFGVNLKWSINGGSFVDIPASAYSTSNTLSLQDTQPANGTPDYLEVDSDTDGLADWSEMQGVMGGAFLDSDGDATPDCLDTDSDDDNTPDGSDPNPKSVVVANDSLAISSSGGGTLNVLDNDDFVAGVGVRVEVLASDVLGTVELDEVGDLSYDDSGTPVGNYTIDYEVCNDNVTPSVCAAASVAMSIGPGPVDAAQSSVEASVSSMTADGLSTSIVTVRLLDAAGNLVGADGADVQLQTSLGVLSAITDHGDGTYSAVLTAGTEAGSAQVSGSADGNALPSASLAFLSGPVDSSTSVVSVSEQVLPANGTSTSVVTVALKDSAGNALTVGGETVVLASTLGSLSDVVDNGDGTYVAVLTAGVLEGEAVISGTAGGFDLPDASVVFVANTFSFSGAVFRDTNGDDALDPSDRDGQRSASEDEISGVTVSLVGPGPDAELETSDDVTIATATTASPYSFEGIPAGDYLLVIGDGTVPEHYLPTIAGIQRVTVSASGVTGETDFGYAPRVIAGVLTDHTGAFVSGVVITYTADGGEMFSVTTNAVGSYLLGEGLDPIPSPDGELRVEIDGFTTIRAVTGLGVFSSVSLEVEEQGGTVPSTVPPTVSPSPTVPEGSTGSLPVSGSNSLALIVAGWSLVVAGSILDRVGRKLLTV